MASKDNDVDIFRERSEFGMGFLEEDNLPDNPITLFTKWYDEACLKARKDAEAFVLSTVSREGEPSSRIVYLRNLKDDAFVFYTNYQSNKGMDILHNPNVAMNFFWKELERQIKIKGTARKVPPADSDAYFASRPFDNQVSAWASHQSSEVDGREALENDFTKYAKKYEGKTVPRPPYWGGYGIIPEKIEFWQGRPGRLHDRIVYTRTSNRWTFKRLSP